MHQLEFATKLVYFFLIINYLPVRGLYWLSILKYNLKIINRRSALINENFETEKVKIIYRNF